MAGLANHASSREKRLELKARGWSLVQMLERRQTPEYRAAKRQRREIDDRNLQLRARSDIDATGTVSSVAQVGIGEATFAWSPISRDTDGQTMDKLGAGADVRVAEKRAVGPPASSPAPAPSTQPNLSGEPVLRPGPAAGPGTPMAPAASPPAGPPAMPSPAMPSPAMPSPAMPSPPPKPGSDGDGDDDDDDDDDDDYDYDGDGGPRSSSSTTSTTSAPSSTSSISTTPPVATTPTMSAVPAAAPPASSATTPFVPTTTPILQSQVSPSASAPGLFTLPSTTPSYISTPTVTNIIPGTTIVVSSPVATPLGPASSFGETTIFIPASSSTSLSSTNPATAASGKGLTGTGGNGLSTGAVVAAALFSALGFLVLLLLLFAFRKRLTNAVTTGKDRLNPASDEEKAETGAVVRGIWAAPLVHLSNSLRRSLCMSRGDMSIGEPTLVYTTNRRFTSRYGRPVLRRNSDTLPAKPVPINTTFEQPIQSVPPPNLFSDKAVIDHRLPSLLVEKGSEADSAPDVPPKPAPRVVVAGIGSAPEAPLPALSDGLRQIIASNSMKKKTQAEATPAEQESPTQESQAPNLANLTLAERAQLRRNKEREKIIAETTQRLLRDPTPRASAAEPDSSVESLSDMPSQVSGSPKYLLTPPTIPVRSDMRTPLQMFSAPSVKSTKTAIFDGPAPGSPGPSDPAGQQAQSKFSFVSTPTRSDGSSEATDSILDGSLNPFADMSESGFDSRDVSWNPNWPITKKPPTP